jgi:hypothetical protein
LFTDILTGQEVNTGDSLSVTVTLNEHIAEFPFASVAVKVTSVVPTGNVDPLGNPDVCAITIPGQLSLAAGAVQFTTAPQTPGVLFTEIFTGHEVKTGS